MAGWWGACLMAWWLVLLVIPLIAGGVSLMHVRHANGLRHRQALQHIRQLEAELGIGVVTVSRLGPPSNYTQVWSNGGAWFKKELQPDGSWETTRLPDGPTQLEKAAIQVGMNARSLMSSAEYERQKQEWLQDQLEPKTVVLPSGERVSEQERVRRETR